MIGRIPNGEFMLALAALQGAAAVASAQERVTKIPDLRIIDPAPIARADGRRGVGSYSRNLMKRLRGKNHA